MSHRSTSSTNALLAHLVRLVLFCVLLSVAGSTGDAASLFGKVIEVNSGDVITIFNMNRPVRVKLLGVDAPEMNQAFGDVAKKHLSDLVFDKGVLIQYSGIGADSSLTGRVLLNDADIGAQMIRDGAAWFDVNNGDRLDADNRAVYQQSEFAARNERRGLWGQANPVAPWEFVKAEILRMHPVETPKPNQSAPKANSTRSMSELTNFTLMTRNVKPAAPSAPTMAPDDTEIVQNSELPAGLPFTALLPRGGMRLTKSTIFGADVVKTNGYVVAEGGNGYSVVWFTAPTYGEDDKTATDQMVFNELTAQCTPQNEKDISANGYWGREVDLSDCPIPTRVRVFTKATGDRREVYVAMVSVRNDNANVKRFLNTFTIRKK
ncbi:MAG TPA: thermonuclease family protein [Pyrinomonadaceae bacterium]|nr:thermonuclease family protein [Pyrinomonadaceae bacterium]